VGGQVSFEDKHPHQVTETVLVTQEPRNHLV
jgi:hypothetical protein